MNLYIPMATCPYCLQEENVITLGTLLVPFCFFCFPLHIEMCSYFPVSFQTQEVWKFLFLQMRLSYPHDPGDTITKQNMQPLKLSKIGGVNHSTVNQTADMLTKLSSVTSHMHWGETKKCAINLCCF